ncbi:XkdX family protein [Cytobacillus praedii]|uniref:XkdX family protein n=1 Tax=Cytobacillus praedii TaxID=1742358 RepID=A0A4R1B4M0_9BACI|nr:XkdX family protein [Cytobacillus praedii]TCJ05037.1 XkdX family protein [Cytobacillus praedii]
MSKWYATVKKYYDMGLYINDPSSDKYVGIFVQAGWIKEEEYKTITKSDEYIPPNAA